jgi:hypothetical protein
VSAKNCENCWYGEAAEDIGAWWRGYCRRYPPFRQSLNHTSVCPTVLAEDWCGEWEDDGSEEVRG